MVIFDCDGVVVDSELIANRLLQCALEELGLEYTLWETIDAFMGRSTSECIREIEARIDGSVPETFWPELQQRTWDAFDRQLTAVPGITGVLETLTEDYCLASSGSRDKIHRTLTITGLLPWFEGRIFSAVDVARGKPHPDLFLHAAAHRGHNPEDCRVIEDSEPGVLAGLAAGMQVFGFCRTTPTEKLAKAGVVTFTDMRELPGLLKEHREEDAND